MANGLPTVLVVGLLPVSDSCVRAKMLFRTRSGAAAVRRLPMLFKPLRRADAGPYVLNMCDGALAPPLAKPCPLAPPLAPLAVLDDGDDGQNNEPNLLLDNGDGWAPLAESCASGPPAVGEPRTALVKSLLLLPVVVRGDSV